MYAWLYVLFLVCSVLLHECFFAGQSACRHSFRRKTARTLTIATARASIGKCTTSSEHLTNAQQALRRPCAPPASRARTRSSGCPKHELDDRNAPFARLSHHGRMSLSISAQQMLNLCRMSALHATFTLTTFSILSRLRKNTR